jgi:hypothetical protein
MQISITTNAPIVRQGLENLALEIPNIGRRRVYNVMLKVRTRAKIYPKERIGQKYVRTYRLRENWNIERLKNGYMITNPTPYTKYVMGDAYGTSQAWMHISTDQGPRWTKTRDIVEQGIVTLPDEIREEINMVARRYKL